MILKVVLLILCSPGLGVATPLPAASAYPSTPRVRHIILSSRHLGAHGLGYNSQSLWELSQKLTPADIPALISLLADRSLAVGVQFALASQCAAAIFPVRDAAVRRKVDFLDASDVMNLISEFEGCTPGTKEDALAMRAEIDKFRQEEQATAEQEARQRAEDDARIQRNALRMSDPKQAKELTREEREEVYRRSLKAMGLSENGPMTPQQRKLVDRMYRTMVLGQHGATTPQQSPQ